jgi:nicotinamide-nucleotide amidase
MATAEIICIGTELLLGEILNSNAQYLAQELAKLGISHHFQTVVGDNIDRIHQVLAIACNRSQIIITTGGLGPTPDDLTTEAIASFFHTPLQEHPDIWSKIQQDYSRSGRTPTDNNRKQAFLPQGAEILTNSVGTAPGMIWKPYANLLILTFPGVPNELYTMWQEVAVPYLKNNGYVDSVLHSRVLLYWGIPESALASKVEPFFQLTNPTVAPYANYGQARLRITAKAATTAEAMDLIAPVEAQILQLTGADCYGKDDDTLASVVGNQLQARHQTLAIAESCTGGLVGDMLTSIAGSSAYFQGGVISYSNQAKIDLLGVNPHTLATEGAVSAATAQQMAQGVAHALKADWGLSITGIAGPTGATATKPVGLVYIGLYHPHGQVTAQEYRFNPSRGRNWIRRVSACSALDQLRRSFAMIDTPK